MKSEIDDTGFLIHDNGKKKFSFSKVYPESCIMYRAS
jgi:hypothetical protein